MIFKYFFKMPARKILLATILFFIMVSNCPGVEIIVNASVPDRSYSVHELRSIFAMQRLIWSNGERIQVFVLADDDPVHREFTKTKLNMFPHQFRRIWDRLLFSGTGHPPRQVGSPGEMIERISTIPNSIGYTGTAPENENIRILRYE